MKRKYDKPTIEIIGLVISPILSASDNTIYLGGNDETVNGGQYGAEHRTDWDNIWENL